MPNRYATTVGTVLAASAARDAYRKAKSLVGRSKKKGATKRYYYPRARLYTSAYPTSATTKRALVLNAAGKNLDSRTLYSNDLTWIAHADTGNDINARQRDTINCRGFKINMKMIVGLGASIPNNQAMYFHWAVVVPKFGSASNIPQSRQVDPLSVGDFFRGNSENRAINFSNGLSGLEVNVLPINTDTYTVLTRGRELLVQYSTSGPEKDAFASVSAWVPYARQVRYDNETVGGDTENCATAGRAILCYWCEFYQGMEADQVPIGNSCSIDQHVVTYFKEPM